MRQPSPSRPELIDGRQSARALDIARGTARLLGQHGMRCITELSLANGRRADILAIGEAGEVWIVEIKSSLEDFRTDQKWPDYRDYCDRLYFAVAPDFPLQVLPAETGLMIADRYGGELARPAPEHKLASPRRRALVLHFAQVAAGRLMALSDPDAALESVV